MNANRWNFFEWTVDGRFADASSLSLFQQHRRVTALLSPAAAGPALSYPQGLFASLRSHPNARVRTGTG